MKFEVYNPECEALGAGLATPINTLPIPIQVQVQEKIEKSLQEFHDRTNVSAAEAAHATAGSIIDLEKLVDPAQIMDLWATYESFDPQRVVNDQACFLLTDKAGRQEAAFVTLTADTDSPNGASWDVEMYQIGKNGIREDQAADLSFKTWSISDADAAIGEIVSYLPPGWDYSALDEVLRVPDEFEDLVEQREITKQEIEAWKNAPVKKYANPPYPNMLQAIDRVEIKDDRVWSATAKSGPIDVTMTYSNGGEDGRILPTCACVVKDMSQTLIAHAIVNVYAHPSREAVIAGLQQAWLECYYGIGEKQLQTPYKGFALFSKFQGFDGVCASPLEPFNHDNPFDAMKSHEQTKALCCTTNTPELTGVEIKELPKLFDIRVGNSELNVRSVQMGYEPPKSLQKTAIIR